MPTIRDVATYAGVSVATVSHVINNTRFVDPQTVERVRGAIDALGYRPNSLARSLRGHKTKTIGMLVPDNSNPFFANIARSVEDTVFGQGYSVILCNSDDSTAKETAYVDALLSKRVDGLILISSGNSSKTVNLILEANVPVVVVDRELDNLPVDQVLIDNEAAGYQAGHYLVSKGHTRIGYIMGPNNLSLSAHRITGFRRAMAEVGLELANEAIMRGDFQYAGGERAMSEFLRRGLDLTAIFATNDRMAIGALTVLARARLRVPDEVSILGFDNILESTSSYPALTTVGQPSAEMGQIGVTLLLERIQNKGSPEAARRIVLPTTIIERASCRALEPGERYHKNGVLNRSLAHLIETMGPGDLLVVGGAGLPVPEGIPCIDLAVTIGLPTVIDVLRAISVDLDVERLLIMQELYKANVELPVTVQAMFPGANVELIEIDRFQTLSVSAKAVVRTGDVLPYAHVMIYRRASAA